MGIHVLTVGIHEVCGPWPHTNWTWQKLTKIAIFSRIPVLYSGKWAQIPWVYRSCGLGHVHTYLAHIAWLATKQGCTEINKNSNFLGISHWLILETASNTVGIGDPDPGSSHTRNARITHKETYFRAEYVPTWTFGLCARRCGSYATPAQGRITHKYVIQDYVPARFKGGLRSKPPSHTRKREKGT